MRRVFSATAVATTIAVLAVSANAAANVTPPLFKNCTNLNTKYHHGVGKYGAHDRTSSVPVTTFFHSTLLYKRTMSYNRCLDRDKDGIACEKH